MSGGMKLAGKESEERGGRGGKEGMEITFWMGKLDVAASLVVGATEGTKRGVW